MATPRLGLVVEDKPTELSCNDNNSLVADSGYVNVCAKHT